MTAGVARGTRSGPSEEMHNRVRKELGGEEDMKKK